MQLLGLVDRGIDARTEEAHPTQGPALTIQARGSRSHSSCASVSQVSWYHHHHSRMLHWIYFKKCLVQRYLWDLSLSSPPSSPTGHGGCLQAVMVSSMLLGAQRENCASVVQLQLVMADPSRTDWKTKDRARLAQGVSRQQGS